MDDHRDISLLEILEEKQCIVTRIEDFDIDCVWMKTREYYARNNLGNFGKSYYCTFIGKDMIF
jgi:hypothetical protein